MAILEVAASEAPGGNSAGPPPPLPTNGATGNMSAADSNSATALSADEIALYDRQIRLWGAQAQERIRSANILLVSLRALGTEIAKNLTLAGVSSLTIVDDELVTEEDLGAQYFLREEDVGKPRADSAVPRIQELNPRVTVQSGGSLANLLAQDQYHYTPFECVIACDHDLEKLSRLNLACRLSNTSFYAAGLHGFYGYIFVDLFAHEFVIEREKSNISTVPGPESITRVVTKVSTKKQPDGKTMEVVTKQELYCPLVLANSSPLPLEVTSNRRKLKAVPALLPCLRALFDFQREAKRFPDSHVNQDMALFTQLARTKSSELLLPPETLRADFLRSFIQNIGAEMVPTAAFVGGRLSEDVINVLGKREQPIQNFALFDGDGLEGKIYCLFTTPPELTMAAQMNGMSAMPVGDIGLGIGAGLGMANGVGFMPDGTPLDGGMGLMPMGMGMGVGMPMVLDDVSAAAMAQGMPMDAGVGAELAGMAPVASAATTDETAPPAATAAVTISGEAVTVDATSAPANGAEDTQQE